MPHQPSRPQAPFAHATPAPQAGQGQASYPGMLPGPGLPGQGLPGQQFPGQQFPGQGIGAKAHKGRSIRSVPIVLTLIAAAVVVAVVWGFYHTTRPFNPLMSPALRPPADLAVTSPQPGDSTDPPAALTPAPEVIRPVVESVSLVDSEGERADGLELTIDGDPTTGWRSFRYVTSAFGSLRPGVGIAVRLAQPAPVHSITLYTPDAGGMMEIRATSADNPLEGPVIASGPFGDPSTEFVFPDDVVTDTLLIWISDLPPVMDGYMATIYEIIVH